MGKVILIASGKGGVGKTMFTANAGAILAQRGKKILLIDMNTGLRNLDLFLGLESKVVYDIADVLAGVCRIKQALIRDRRFPELYLMAAAQNKEKTEITPLHMKVLCNKLRKTFDYILMDVAAGIDESLSLASAGADSAVLVIVPEYVSIRDADVVDGILLGQGIKDRKYVVNKVQADLLNTGLVPSLSEIAEVMRPKLAGIIQQDKNIHIAANNGMPIVMKTGSYIEKNFSNIVDRIIE